MDLNDCATPALVLDRGRLRHNAETMRARCRARGAHLRPHMKTLKCVEAAREAIDPDHGGIAVSTLREALFFAEAGFSDIQLALCLPPQKLAEAAAVAARAHAFSFFIDSVEAADAIVARTRAESAAFRVWIELDCGEHRTGVAPDDASLLEIAARLAAAPSVTLAGVATHAGHAYSVRSAEAIAEIADAERDCALRGRDRLREAGFGDVATSVGSTPTAVQGGALHGVNEVRAGVYMAGDLYQANIGSHGLNDMACTVLATVISHNRWRNQIVVDAGGLALSKDRSTAQTPWRDFGYGLVLDVNGADAYGGLCVVDVHQEHGEIRADQTLPFERLPIGAKVRIAPNHVCMTAAMYPGYAIVDGDTRIVDHWRRVNGWSGLGEAA